jgi:hypothetical protein
MTEPDDDLFAELDDVDETVGGETLDGDTVDGETLERVHAPRRVLVVFGAVLAAFVFIGVAGTALIFFIVLRIRDHTDPNHTVRAKYSNSYASCVQGGGNQYSCGIKVLQACEKDSWWQKQSRVGQRETVCLATVPDVTGD